MQPLRVSEMIPRRAKVGANEEGQQRQPALHLLRTMRRGAIVPVVITRCVDVGACEGASRASRPYTSCE